MARVLVCGAGSIGQRHAGNLTQLGAEVMLWRKRLDLLEETACALRATPCRDLQSGLEAADAVIVATATNEHIPVALMAAGAGKALFIEKPLSNEAEGVAELVEQVKARNLVCEVGCQLRAHPVLRNLASHLGSGREGRVLAFRGAVGQRLDLWRPGSDYRQSYSSDTAKGGGALFDLIHEIDLTLWLVGPIATVLADLRQISDQHIKADDLANLILVSENGAAGQLQMDMLSPVYRRTFEIVTERALFIWDYNCGSVRRADRDGEKVFIRSIGGFGRNDLFLKHMAHFLKRLDDPRLAPLCGLREGTTALNVALAARRAAEKGERITVSPATSPNSVGPARE